MAKVKIKFHYDGFDKLRKSYQAEIDERARRIAAQAGEGMSVKSEPSRKRARALVYTDTIEAAENEARDGALSKALTAGQG